MAIRNEQIEEKAKRQKVGSDPVVASDEGVFQTKLIGSVVEGFYFDNQGRSIQITDNGLLKIPLNLGVMSASNAGTVGEGILKLNSGSDLQFKRLIAGAGVQLNPLTDGIEIISTPVSNPGGDNTGMNIGVVGAVVFKQKVGAEFQFRRIKAGANTTVAVNINDEIEISSVGGGGSGGEINTASNLGSLVDGEGLVTAKSGVDLPFKRILAGANIAVSSLLNSVIITGTGEANVLVSLGSPTDGEPLEGLKVGANLFLKRLKAGSGISLVPDANAVIINSLWGGGSGSNLLRYVIQATSGEEVSVFADGPGVTYSRTTTTGTLTVPVGVRVISARLRLPMLAITGTTFTIVYGFGDSTTATGYSNFYPPNLTCWREDTGGQVAINSSFAAGHDRIYVTGLTLSQTNNLKLVW